MDEGSGDKRELVLTEIERITFLDDEATIGVVAAEEALHHIKGKRLRDNLRLGIRRHELGDACGVIRLHMLNDKIVDLLFADLALEILEPLRSESGVDCIHYRDLIVDNHIRIIGHAEWNLELTFKKIDLMIVNADVFNIFANLHNATHCITPTPLPSMRLGQAFADPTFSVPTAEEYYTTQVFIQRKGNPCAD